MTEIKIMVHNNSTFASFSAVEAFQPSVLRVQLNSVRISEYAVLGFQVFRGHCSCSTGREAVKARLSVEGDLLRARPCQLWGTEVWPLRCLTSSAASGPASQLQYTAYLEQRHVLNNRPKTKIKNLRAICSNGHHINRFSWWNIIILKLKAVKKLKLSL